MDKSKTLLELGQELDDLYRERAKAELQAYFNLNGQPPGQDKLLIMLRAAGCAVVADNPILVQRIGCLSGVTPGAGFSLQMANHTFSFDTLGKNNG